MRSFLPALMIFGYTMAFRGFMAYLPLYLNTSGFRGWQIGMLVGVFQVGPLLLVTPFGMIGDRFSPRKLTIIGLELFTVAIAASAIFQSFVPLLVVFVIAGLGGTLFRVNNSSLRFKTVGEERRGMELAWFNAACALGFGIGPLAVGTLTARWLGTTFPPMLWGAVCAVLFIPAAHFLESVRTKRVSVRRYVTDVAARGVWPFFAASFLWALHFGVEMSSFSLLLRQEFSIGHEGIGFIYLAICLVLAVTILLSGHLLDRVSSPLVVGLVGAVLSAVGNIGVLWVGSVGTLLAVRCVHTVGDSMFWMFTSVFISRRFLTERVGGTLGVWGLVSGAGSFVGAILGGAIPGNRAPFVAVGLLGLISVALLFATNVNRDEMPASNPK